MRRLFAKSVRALRPQGLAASASQPRSVGFEPLEQRQLFAGYSLAVIAAPNTAYGRTYLTASNNVGQLAMFGDTDAYFYSKGAYTPIGNFVQQNPPANWQPGNTNNYPWAMNNLGEVVGQAMANHVVNGQPTINYDAYTWVNGTLTDIAPAGSTLMSRADAINDAGQVVGDVQEPDNTVHTFLYSNGVDTDLGAMGGTMAIPTRISASGTIYGTVYAADGSQKVFIYAAGKTTTITSPLGGNESLGGMNAAGSMILNSYTATQSAENAYVISSNGTVTNLGSLGGTYTGAGSINNSGQIIGESTLPNPVDEPIPEGFLYTNGRMQQLPSLVSGQAFNPTGLTDAGVVYGYALASDESFHGVIYSNGQLQDVNDLVSTSYNTTVNTIEAPNAQGVIIGSGSLNSHPYDGYAEILVLTPLTSGTADAGTTLENTPVKINVLANDTAAPGATLAVTATTAPKHGTVAINTDGTLTYTPTRNYAGVDSFTYTISDGVGGTSTATVSLTVLSAAQVESNAITTVTQDLVSRGVLSARAAAALNPVLSNALNAVVTDVNRLHIPANVATAAFTQVIDSIPGLSAADQTLLITTVQEVLSAG